MASTTLAISDELLAYLRQQGVRESKALARLRIETQSLPLAVMQISPEQGQFMQMICKLLGVRRAIEVGVFTGYSTLCIAEALPSDGYLLACDNNREYTNIAERHWQAAAVQEKIDLQIADAIHTLDKQLASGYARSFDMAFIDADKENYHLYYERCLKLLRPGGIILIDNVLWSGDVLDPRNQQSSTIALRKLNDRLRLDQRIDISMNTIGDGLTLCRKR